MPISSPGLGSGLDVTGIVSQLMAVEQQPLVRLNEKEAQAQAEISAYGSLKGGMSSLQSALVSLKDSDSFQATKATPSNDDIFSASSDETAVKSSYSVTVSRLAQQHKTGSDEFASTATFGGSAGDQLTLTVGTESFILDLSTALTLSEIQSAINVDSNETDVTAGLITGDSGNQTLVFTSGSSGYDNRVQLSYGGTINASTFNFSMLNRDDSNVLLSAETELDASLTIDGVSVTRSSNTISDVVTGLTLNLKSLGTSNVSIDSDPSVAQTAMDAFVKAYNTLKDQLASLSASGASGSVLRNVDSQLRGVLNTSLSGLGSYSYISELGITSNADTGKMEFNSEMFNTALADNPSSVVDFLTDETGFGARFDSMIEGFISSGGTLDTIIQSGNTRIDGFERSRDSLERRLENIEARYLRQFGALDTLMASLTTTSDYLTSQLDILANIATGNNT